VDAEGIFMAGAAVALQFGFETPQLEAEPHQQLVQLEQEPRLPFLINADTIPALRARRFKARQAAFQIRGQNREYLMEGDLDQVPIPVDPLGTARRVAQVPEYLAPGVRNPHYIRRFDALVLDCQRLRAEAIRKNIWEIYSPLLRRYNAAADDYFANDIALKADIIAHGLSPIIESESEDGLRRTNEYVEEDSYPAVAETAAQMLGRAALGNPASVVTFSECTDAAIAAYKNGQPGMYGGMVPEIEKLVIRGVRFLPNRDRLDESVAIRGTFITREVILAVLQDIEAIAPGQNPTKTELHGMQFISLAGRRPLDFVTLLDAKAGELTGKNIFMGEEVPAGHPKNYDEVIAEAAAREASSWVEAHKLAEYVMQLQHDQVDPWAAAGLVETRVKKSLWLAVKDKPEEAEIIFDKKTADGLRQVEKLRASGQEDEALRLLEKVEAAAPPPAYCTAGACGLKLVSSGSPEAAKARALGLSGETIIHDEERACPGCGAMEVYYDDKGSKACTSCGNSELK
jgi:hypothetical protein